VRVEENEQHLWATQRYCGECSFGSKDKRHHDGPLSADSLWDNQLSEMAAALWDIPVLYR
jgi:hypothetical protein